jgi:hypothetical protein
MRKYEDEYREHQSMLKEEEKEAYDKEQEMLASIQKRNFSLIGDYKDETMIMIEANMLK